MSFDEEFVDLCNVKAVCGKSVNCWVIISRINARISDKSFSSRRTGVCRAAIEDYCELWIN